MLQALLSGRRRQSVRRLRCVHFFAVHGDLWAGWPALGRRYRLLPSLWPHVVRRLNSGIFCERLARRAQALSVMIGFPVAFGRLFFSIARASRRGGGGLWGVFVPQIRPGFLFVRPGAAGHVVGNGW